MQGIHYGTPTANSLHLLRFYFEKYPEDAEKVVVSIKGALAPTREPAGSPEAICASVEEAYEVLKGVKSIDVFEMARVDPNVPIEVSIKALAELVAEGKIGGIGLSEVSAGTIRRASAVHKIAAVEIELSLFTPDPLHNGIVQTCQERKLHNGPTVSPFAENKKQSTFLSLHTALLAVDSLLAHGARTLIYQRATSATCLLASSPTLSSKMQSSYRPSKALRNAKTGPLRR